VSNRHFQQGRFFAPFDQYAGNFSDQPAALRTARVKSLNQDTGYSGRWTDDSSPAHAAAFWAEHMRHGDFEAAWRISDESRRSERAFDRRLPRHFQSVWRGASLKKRRILIRCYHGLGDTIQFIRYATLVKAIAAEVIVSAQPELIPLLQTIPAIDRVIALDHEPHPYDIDIEVMELPYALRTNAATIPADVPYLHVPKSTLPVEDRLGVGIVWASGDWNRRRSIPLAQLAPLMSISGIKLFAFQRGAPLGPAGHLAIHHLNWRDVVHEAALMQSLHLLISVDTMPAHLAGALGLPVWLLLHADADWRWMRERDDSPWYPTMRLFRQHRPGNWQPVLDRVAAELRALSAAHRQRSARNGAVH
jgi:hypothetical protein